MSKNQFGELFTELRALADYTLRQFCKELDIDAGNWSRVERGLATPPTDDAFYAKIVKMFDINEEVRDRLISLAKTAKILPKELQETELMEHMPVMLRKIDGQQLKPDEIEKLVAWIRDTVDEENGKKRN